MMTIQQAFEAMVWFIKQFQERGPFHDTGQLLDGLHRLLAGEKSDEAISLWREWYCSIFWTLHYSGLSNEFPVFELAEAPCDEQELSSDVSLTILQTYLATQVFLQKQYLKIQDDEGGIDFLLSNMALNTWNDSFPADPAFWSEWMGSVQQVLLPNTPENKQLLTDLITHRENFLGKGPNIEEWYARLLPDGRQLWAEVIEGKIYSAGIRRTPIDFDPTTGLSTPLHP